MSGAAKSHVTLRSEEELRARASLIEGWSRLHRSSLVRFLQKRAPGGVDVEDLVQDVFLRIARREDVRDIADAQRYLFECASNALRDHARQRAARNLDAHDTLDEDALGQDLSPERVLIGKQAIETVAEALRELPYRTRAVFVLRRFENLKYSEIARRLGVSKSAVEKHMAKAHKHLLQATGRGP